MRAGCSRSNGFINVCMEIGLFTLIRATFFRGTNEAGSFKKACRLAVLNANIFMDDALESTENNVFSSAKFTATYYTKMLSKSVFQGTSMNISNLIKQKCV